MLRSRFVTAWLATEADLVCDCICERADSFFLNNKASVFRVVVAGRYFLQ